MAAAQSELLKAARTIAVVGLSDKEDRPSNMVARYLQRQGYRIIPVNPGHTEILGERCYPDLASVPLPVDIVDVFRRSEDVPAIAMQAAAMPIRCFWMQQGVRSAEARTLLEARGVTVVEDSCIKIVHQQTLEAHP